MRPSRSSPPTQPSPPCAAYGSKTGGDAGKAEKRKNGRGRRTAGRICFFGAENPPLQYLSGWKFGDDRPRTQLADDKENRRLRRVSLSRSRASCRAACSRLAEIPRYANARDFQGTPRQVQPKPDRQNKGSENIASSSS